jgi:outer membrane protein with beta-barrel domain
MLSSVRRSLFVAGAIAASTTAPAQAQFNSTSGTKGFAITAEAGGYFASQLYNVAGANLHFGDAFTYGGRLLYTPAPHFGIEVGYMYASSDVTSDVAIGGAPSKDLGSLGLNEIDLNGLFGGGNGKLYGYFTLGLGMTIIDPKVNPDLGADNVASSTKFAWNLGGGGFFMFNPKVGLRVDGRFRTIDTNKNTGSGSYCYPYYGCYSYATTWYNSGELTGGITVRF